MVRGLEQGQRGQAWLCHPVRRQSSIAGILSHCRELAVGAKSGSGSEARVQASAGLRPLRLVTFDGVTGAA
jgi:hypothetical protein